MSLYTRLRGGQGVRDLPVWPVINSFIQLTADEIDDSVFVSRFNLSADEQAEFAQIKTKVQTELTTAIASLAVLVSQELAETLANSAVNAKYREILLRAEHGYYTEDQFNSAMGIS